MDAPVKTEHISSYLNAALHFLDHAKQKMHFMIILYLKVVLDGMIGSANR